MPADLQPSFPRALFIAGLVAAILLTADSAGPASPSPKTSPAAKRQIAETYGKLPLSFEANTGQTDKRVKFLARGSGYGLYLTGNEAVLTLESASQKSKVKCQKAKVKSPADTGVVPTFGALCVGENWASPGLKSGAVKADLTAGAKRPRTTDSVWRMKLLGANIRAEVKGAEELPGKVNYFIGNDPAKWHTGIPTYAKVRYRGIYPGIDLVYYGNQRQLEYDFVVAPGADPGVIALDVAAGLSRHASSKSGGVKSKCGGEKSKSGGVKPPLQIAANGDLVIKTDAGEIRFRKPVAYQERFTVDSSQLAVQDKKRDTTANAKSKIQNRKSLDGRYVLTGTNQVRFALGPYDRTRPLVIDPALAYSTYVGGSGEDSAKAIAVDAAGNAYLAGMTSSTDFPVTPGAYQTSTESVRAFVTKLNPGGTALVYSTYLGGSTADFGMALAVDTAGNVYVAGQTYSTDFPVTPGAFQTTNKAAANGDANAFVAKLNPTGTALAYSTYLGGSGLAAGGLSFGDKANALGVDTAGNAYVAGQTFSTDFPVTPGAFQTTNNAGARGFPNAFLTKLDPAGTALVYSTYLGGIGGALLYDGDIGNAIAVDATGDAYVAGETFSPDFPVTVGAFQASNNALGNQGANAFVTELNPAGTALVYSTYLGGSGGDSGNAIAVDTSGNMYVAGQTGSADFPVTPGAFQTTYSGAANTSPNAFVTKLNPGGTALVYSTYLGGSGGAVNVLPTLAMLGGDLATGLAIDNSGNVYLTGSTASANFPVTPGAYQSTNNDQPPCGGECIGGYNAFITELDSAGSALVYSTYLGGNGINPGDSVGVLTFGEGDQASALALDNSGNVYITGSAVSYDFPVTAGAFQTTVSSRSENAFVAKLNMGATSTAIAPTVTVTPASSTITSARPLAVTVSVSGGSGNPTPTGTVTLASGTYASAATTLSGGSATINIPAGSLLAEPPGYAGDGLIAQYVPDAASSSTYNSAPGLALVTVVAPSISVTPSSSYLSTAQAQSQALPVALVATGGTGNPTPTGTVTLSTGSYTSTATALSGGSASISIPPGTLATGFNTLDVSYSGDGNYAAVPIAGSALVTVGTGTPGFTITAAPNTISMGAGLVAMSTITVTPAGGFTGSVALAAAITSGPNGAQSPPMVNFGGGPAGTSPVSITGPTAGTATLDIQTTASNCAPGNLINLRVPWYPTGAAGLACLLLFCIPGQRRRLRRSLAKLALAAALAGGMLACGSTSNCPPATTTGTYTVTITGTSGSTTATGTVTLNVNE